MNFREISQKDFSEWISLGIALWPHYSKKKKTLEKIFFKIFSSPKQTVFLCKDNGIAIAFVNVSLRSDYVQGCTASPVGYIEGIFVKPEYRKLGVAKELIALAEKWSKKHGCKELGSDTELENVNSHEFHKNLGFQKAGTIVHFVKKIK